MFHRDVIVLTIIININACTVAHRSWPNKEIYMKEDTADTRCVLPVCMFSVFVFACMYLGFTLTTFKHAYVSETFVRVGETKTAKIRRLLSESRGGIPHRGKFSLFNHSQMSPICLTCMPNIRTKLDYYVIGCWRKIQLGHDKNKTNPASLYDRWQFEMHPYRISIYRFWCGVIEYIYTHISNAGYDVIKCV